MKIGQGGLRVLRLFGIDIVIDWSWLFIFVLVTWSLAMGVFAQGHPYWSPAFAWGVAIAAALLFFASLLVHEMAHSLVAKRRGMPVRKIVLFLFGGVSDIEREPSSPGAEFLMAVVGPITSLILGVFFLWLGTLYAGGFEAVLDETRGSISLLNPVSTLLLWLGPINILIGFFNLIPGFPLDGGRLLRALLWTLTKNLHKATVWAAGVGQGIAWLFIVGGIAMVFGTRLPFFQGGIISGLWLAFIGWFLNSAAIQSSQQLFVDEALEDVSVSRLMRPDFHAVPSDMPVGSLVHDWTLGTDEHAFLVVDKGRLAGLVSLQDVHKVPRDRWDVSQVRAIMTPADRLIVTAPQEHVSDALRRLNGHDVRQLPVIQDGHPIGMLRLADIVRWLRFRQELEGSF